MTSDPDSGCTSKGTLLEWMQEALSLAPLNALQLSGRQAVEIGAEVVVPPSVTRTACAGGTAARSLDMAARGRKHLPERH